jgi:hypothetical protein
MRHLDFLAAVSALAIISPAAGAQDRQSDNSFKWTGAIEAGHSVYARNLNGAVRMEAGSGNEVEVRAEKKWRRGDPQDVKVTAEKTSRGDVLVCVIYVNRNTRCDEDGYSVRGHDNRGDRNDVSVDLIIRVPKGAKVDASTVNGGLTIEGAGAEVKASTVNGGIQASSTGGPVSAHTVNGSITVRAGALGTGPLAYETVNGSITIELPADLNADLDMSTVNGSISSDDFPITVQGRFDRRHIAGKIGKGGVPLHLKTVNGSIRLRKN